MLPMPEFSRHNLRSADLTKGSWFRLFASAPSEWVGSSRFFRKIVLVRIPRCCSFYISQNYLFGLNNMTPCWCRKFYGVVYFHIRNSTSSNIPFVNNSQLTVRMAKQADPDSVSIYFTEKTRLTNQVYTYEQGDIQPSHLIEVTAADFSLSMRDTERMLKKEYDVPFVQSHVKPYL